MVRVPTDTRRGEPVAESRLEPKNASACSHSTHFERLWSQAGAVDIPGDRASRGLHGRLHAPVCTAAKRQAPATCKRKESCDLARDNSYEQLAIPLLATQHACDQ